LKHKSRLLRKLYSNSFDFWHQFDAAQALEELRLYRPAVYQALPAGRDA